MTDMPVITCTHKKAKLNNLNIYHSTWKGNMLQSLEALIINAQLQGFSLE